LLHQALDEALDEALNGVLKVPVSVVETRLFTGRDSLANTGPPGLVPVEKRTL
jgi:hypothetical protein